MNEYRRQVPALIIMIGFAFSLHASAQHVDPTLDTVRAWIERYDADLDLLNRRYDAPMSREAADRRREFFDQWIATVRSSDLSSMKRDAQVDSILFLNELNYELRSLEHDQRRWAEMDSLIPFASDIVTLHESRRRFEPVDSRATAAALNGLAERIRETHDTLRADSDGVERSVANRAGRTLNDLQRVFRNWYSFNAGYDPLFTWWVNAPYTRANDALSEYRQFVRGTLANAEDDDTIIGDPVGREELLSMLASEMIPYSPEQLVDIARSEYAWCLNEMLRASRDLGFGEDWKRALEHTKNQHVEPGEQPELVRDLAWEAIEFLETRNLITIPELCKEGWRMEMMSPAQQKISPYFLGGEIIMVAFPTDSMEHDDKLMSLRGNNRHFARATVHHELIPGHHLQRFMNARFRTHRSLFRTPFWIEGWALYWEMRMWDLDFPQSPEDRIGMLFWRMHRCARIVFSLSFHLGDITPQECIDYLVENVGHERNNATAEVRRSVSGAYGPLYQAAYMLGGLQIRALHEELVTSGRMTERAFHDTILEHNAIPVEMVRATLMPEIPLSIDHISSWQFYGDVDGADRQ